MLYDLQHDMSCLPVLNDISGFPPMAGRSFAVRLREARAPEMSLGTANHLGTLGFRWCKMGMDQYLLIPFFGG